jgi:hypothetical protein
LNNLNPYNETQFRKSFELTDLYSRLSQDFTQLTWDKHCDIYKTITPRQFLGDSSISVFSLVPFYYLNYLTETKPDKIYDLGCGWNIFKKYIPNVVGIGDENITDENYYGDQHGCVDQKYVEAHQNYFESVFSINALHFIPLCAMKDRVLDFLSMIAPNGRGFVTLNLMRMIERSSDKFLYDTFGSLRPTNKQCDTYVRNSLADLPYKILVFDVDVLSTLNDVMEGNIRLVFEKTENQHE